MIIHIMSMSHFLLVVAGTAGGIQVDDKELRKLASILHPVEEGELEVAGDAEQPHEPTVAQEANAAQVKLPMVYHMT